MAGPGGSGPMAEIRTKVESGEITMDSARALFATAREGRQGQRGEAGGEAQVGRAARGGSSGEPAFQPAVAFVMDENGVLAPRPVVMGLSDWDYAEILAGLEEGDELALIGAAQLQAQQQERIERMRQRMGGGRPFGD